jgi:hypothetical protein
LGANINEDVDEGSSGYDRIMGEASNYYVITVVDPPIRRTSELRELDVRVLRRGITVRTRRALVGRP